ATITEAIFNGKDGDTYCFYSIAHDFVGNVENTPLQPDACTQVIVSTKEPHNSAYKLFQNIPNPFGDETLIGFVIPEISDIKLTVTNQLGQSQILLHGKFDTGYHQVIYHPISESQNLYYYTLVTPKYSKTLKMIKSK
ncbi:MAG TPA: hypothetical protein VK590_03915, partial [Saprospiraceae bacterium]|nr:hypothetical protein [Saprospiraceae bacterium]